jgi:hypothetical protein
MKKEPEDDISDSPMKAAKSHGTQTQEMLLH